MSAVVSFSFQTGIEGNVSLFQEGETPLIKATKMRNIEIVELLLDKGAKVSALDKVL